LTLRLDAMGVTAEGEKQKPRRENGSPPDGTLGRPRPEGAGDQVEGGAKLCDSARKKKRGERGEVSEAVRVIGGRCVEAFYLHQGLARDEKAARVNKMGERPLLDLKKGGRTG